MRYDCWLILKGLSQIMFGIEEGLRGFKTKLFAKFAKWEGSRECLHIVEDQGKSVIEAIKILFELRALDEGHALKLGPDLLHGKL